MQNLKTLADELIAIKDKKQRFSFYRDTILPVVAKGLHEQYLHYLKINNLNPYHTLVTTLSHNLNITVLLVQTIKPQCCVVFYTPDKQKNMDLFSEFCKTGTIECLPVKLDEINNTANSETIKNVLTTYSKQHKSILCDITGGKKILSFQIGIIAHSLKLDITYIDSQKGFIEWGIPYPGHEVLYIQKPDNVITLLQINPINKLRIRFDKNNNTIIYEADYDNRFYRLGTKSFKNSESETNTLISYINKFFIEIDASILHNTFTFDMLKNLSLSIQSLLFSKELKKFLKKNKTINQLVVDEELCAIPWEILLLHYNIPLPLVRIPNRVLNENIDVSLHNVEKRIALISGSGHGIPGFDSFMQNIKHFCLKQTSLNINTFEAKSSFAMKSFFAQNTSTPLTLVIYYGHAQCGTTPETTGLVCQDGSIFSINDCDILADAPPQCMLVNACQSARGNLFSDISFAHAVLKEGVGTFIGTHFFLQYEQSKEFLQCFLKSIMQNKTYLQSFKDSLVALQQTFGNHDISTYNYVYYGD
ncbi:MAG TPA: hypothetical protein PLV81_13305 [Spirochaetota bacterium]|nr:hypothetical protein [Spirochaetota bacterium]